MFYTVRSCVLSIFIVFSSLIISFAIQKYTYNSAANEIISTTKLEENLQSVKPAKKLTAKKMDQIRCLASNIYYEARGEPFLGQVAVARVVMNRVNSGLFPNDPCKVVYQSHNIVKDDEIVQVCQFSWACNNDLLSINSQTYKYYEKIAKQVLLENKWADLLSEEVYYFHATKVKPKWSKIHNEFATIGNHIFYEQRNQR